MLYTTATIISLNLVLFLVGYGRSNPADFSRFGESADSCSNLQFRCGTGQCIPQDRLCDGRVDCSDKSDETREACNNIRCSPYVFRCEYGACVDGDSICNGIKDCADESDETLQSCSRNNSTSTSSECSVNQFTCKDGQCIDSTSLCDGIIDCRDKSDETSIACGSFPCDAYVFRCAYGACIDMDLRCNGVRNCADGSDEYSSLCATESTSRPSTSRPSTSRPTSYKPTTERTTQRSTSSYTKPTQSFTQTSSLTKITCPVPSQPANGHYKLYKKHCKSEQHCDVNPRVHSLQIGTQLVYSCNSGYKMKGNVDVLCGPDGKWLHVPQCIEIRCEALSSTSRHAECTYHNEKVSCDNPVSPSTTAELRCLQSYHQVQSDYSLVPVKDKVTCDQTGHWSPNPIQCVADCGKIASNTITTLIANGTQAKVSEFPWHASLYKQEPGSVEKKFMCGASIIRENLLVTAAHCVYDERAHRPISASILHVATGNVLRDYNSDSPFVKRGKVKNVYVICSYKGAEKHYENDIALLQLTEPFKFTGLLMPVCLDPKASKEDLQPGNLGKVVGFGKTERGTLSSILRMLTVPYISQEECDNSALKGDFASYVSGDKFCAGYTNGSSVCEGDSGGGLVFRKRELYYLRGIVSLGGCNHHTYSLYTHITNENLDWLYKVMSKLQTEGHYPQCHRERDD